MSDIKKLSCFVMAYDFYPQNELDPSQTIRDSFYHFLIPFLSVYESLFTKAF